MFLTTDFNTKPLKGLRPPGFVFEIAINIYPYPLSWRVIYASFVASSELV